MDGPLELGLLNPSLIFLSMNIAVITAFIPAVLVFFHRAHCLLVYENCGDLQTTGSQRYVKVPNFVFAEVVK